MLEAIDRWQRVGITAEQSAALQDASILITPLPAEAAGAFDGSVIYLDDDGAGHGWFVDPTPKRDEEYRIGGNARAFTEAANRVDLLSAVMHEMGHVIGLDHDHDHDLEVMDEELLPGERTAPDVIHDRIFSQDLWRNKLRHRKTNLNHRRG